MISRSGPYCGYLADSEREIASRLAYLADDAAARRPAWTIAFGAEPVDPIRRALWRRQLGIAAAYRDQHSVAEDDPRHPFGPYVEPGRAGYHAYWHAVEALVNAHADTSPRTALGEDAAHRVSVDTYRALPDPARRAVAATVVGRVGALWQGDISSPDTALTQPAYAVHLRRALRDHGHLVDENLGPQPRSREKEACGHPRSALPRPARKTSPGRRRQHGRVLPRADVVTSPTPRLIPEPGPPQREPGPRRRL